MQAIATNQDVFESHCDMIEVSSLHRPDIGWTFKDAKGHTHRWHVAVKGDRATSYSPQTRYYVPTVVDIFDGWDYYEDGERTARRHFECRFCHERVSPGYKADNSKQYIPGLRHYTINGRSVRPDEFMARWKAAYGPLE